MGRRVTPLRIQVPPRSAAIDQDGNRTVHKLLRDVLEEVRPSSVKYEICDFLTFPI